MEGDEVAANRWPIKATCGSLKKIDDEKTWHKNEDEQQQKNEDVMVSVNERQTHSPFPTTHSLLDDYISKRKSNHVYKMLTNR